MLHFNRAIASSLIANLSAIDARCVIKSKCIRRGPTSRVTSSQTLTHNVTVNIARDTKRAEPGQLQKVTKIGKLTSSKNALKPRLQNLIKQKVGVKIYETEDVDVKDQTKKSNCAADILCAG